MIPYLQVEGISKSWGDVSLFSDIDFTIGKDQKIALIAKNGTGKSTLMDIIVGLNSADSGVITLTNDVRVGYLRQVPDLDDSLTIMEQVLSFDGKLSKVIQDYEKALATDDQELLARSMDLMNLYNCWDLDLRYKQVLSQLKITNFEQRISTLSGGQKKRVALAALLIDQPDIFILDEPTNHLDLEMIEWLEKYLMGMNATLFMVTHDRYFLDRVCDHILELEDNNIYRYNGNYSYFIEKREERLAASAAQVSKAKNLLKTEMEWLRRMPKARGTKSKYRIEQVGQLKEVANSGKRDSALSLDMAASRLGNKIVEFKSVSKSFGDLKILDNFSYNFARFEKIGIVGDNGSGKSTFLNLLTNSIPIDSGEVDTGVTVNYGYYRQDGIKVDENMRVIDVIKDIAEVINFGDGRMWTASNLLTHFLFPPEVQYTQVSKLSGGERRRLYLCTILITNPNFLILDEPTNDLDIVTLNVLEDYLQSFSGCVIIVSHDRYFMDKVVDHLFVFKGNGVISDFPGNYSDFREAEDAKKATVVAPPKEKKVKAEPKKAEKKLSYKEKRELEELDEKIPNLEIEKEELEEKMNSGELSAEELTKLSIVYSELSNLLEECEMRWLELSELS